MIRWLYDRTVRPLLPRKVIVHNGIPARTGRLLDSNDHREQWEELLMEAIRNQPLDGRKIVEVAGGFGICTAEMAKRAGPDGRVISYEVDPERIEAMAETLELNKVRQSVEIRNQYVESVDDDCDILVLDCEGSEREILADDYGDPETIIVETHPVFDVPTEETQETLEEDGYEITAIYEGKNIDVIEAHL
jgi:hypothetical protein